jgi:N-acetylmuramoyl-L-alanine amidase
MIEIRNHRIFVDGKPCAYKETPNKSGALKPEGIILHDTAGGLKADGSIAWLCNPAAKASAHTVIARDGTITQLAPLNVRTWHAGRSNWRGRPNVNGFAIGHEIVNPGKLEKVSEQQYVNGLKVKVTADANHIVREAHSPAHGKGYWLDYTAAQVDTVIGLCTAIRETYGVTFIGTHWEISPGRKINTSPLFPLENVRAKVFGRATGIGKAADKAADNTGVVNVGSLNMRSGPGASNKLIGAIKRGATVNIRSTDHNGDDLWMLVDVGRKSGWVAGRYIDLR